MNKHTGPNSSPKLSHLPSKGTPQDTTSAGELNNVRVVLTWHHWVEELKVGGANGQADETPNRISVTTCS